MGNPIISDVHTTIHPQRIEAECLLEVVGGGVMIKVNHIMSGGWSYCETIFLPADQAPAAQALYKALGGPPEKNETRG